MDEVLKLREFNKLKSVYRMCSVDDRKESAAEHTWSCLILADYFLDKVDGLIDRLKVYELLMYHDVVEIESGDVALEPGVDRSEKQENELAAAKILKERIPSSLSEKFYSLFLEFEEQKTIEAKFAKAIDRLDAQVHEADYKDDWKGWTKAFLVNTMEPYFEPFPSIRSVFLELVDFFEKDGYFNQ